MLVREIFIFLFVFMSSFASIAQCNVDLFQSEYIVSKESKYRDVNLLLPIVIDTNNIFLINLGYKHTKSSWSNQGFSLNQFQTILGLKHDFKKKWTGTFLFIPRVRTMNTLSFTNQKDYQFAGLILLEKLKLKNLTYRFGFYSNKERFSALFVPALGVDWHISKKIQWKTLLPFDSRFYYHFNGRNNLSLYFEGIIESYYSNSFSPSTTSDKVLKNYNHVSSNELSLVYEIEAINHFVVQTKVGLLIGSKYEIYNGNDTFPLALSTFNFSDNRSLKEEKSNNGWLFGLSLIYRYHCK